MKLLIILTASVVDLTLFACMHWLLNHGMNTCFYFMGAVLVCGNGFFMDLYERY